MTEPAVPPPNRSREYDLDRVVEDRDRGIWPAARCCVAATACSGGGGGRRRPPRPRSATSSTSPATPRQNASVLDRRRRTGQNAAQQPDHRLRRRCSRRTASTVAVQRKGKGIFLVSSDGSQTRRLTAAGRCGRRPGRPTARRSMPRPATDSAVVRAASRSTGTTASSHRWSHAARSTASTSRPTATQLVYSRAPEATARGHLRRPVRPLRDEARRLREPSGSRNDGAERLPGLGPGRDRLRALPRAGAPVPDCSAPGIRTIDPDGSNDKAVIDRAPDSINARSASTACSRSAWLDDSHLLIGLRSDSGTEGAVLDLAAQQAPPPRRAFADEVSSDGRYSVGSGGQDALDALDRAPLGRPPRPPAQERLLSGLEPLVEALLRGLEAVGRDRLDGVGGARRSAPPASSSGANGESTQSATGAGRRGPGGRRRSAGAGSPASRGAARASAGRCGRRALPRRAPAAGRPRGRRRRGRRAPAPARP